MAPLIQVFGRKDSRDTQKALRFFKERRVPVSFVDLAAQAAGAHGAASLHLAFDCPRAARRNARAYRDSGMSVTCSLDDDELFERLLSNQSLLRLPLVRSRLDRQRRRRREFVEGCAYRREAWLDGTSSSRARHELGTERGYELARYVTV